MERKVNQFFVEPEVLNRLADAMASAGMNRLGIVCDMAHLATFTDPIAGFATVRRVAHVHLSDGDPPEATHRPMGLGRLPIGEMIEAAIASGVASIAIEGRWRADEEHALDRAAAVLRRRSAPGGHVAWRSPGGGRLSPFIRPWRAGRRRRTSAAGRSRPGPPARAQHERDGGEQ